MSTERERLSWRTPDEQLREQAAIIAKQVSLCSTEAEQTDAVLAFAQQVQEEEREACAVIVDNWEERDLLYTRDAGGWEPDAVKIAAAIRASGQNHEAT